MTIDEHTSVCLQRKSIPCTFVSVWDGGSIEIESPAKYDPDLGLVYDVKMADLPGGVLNSLGILEKEYVRVDAKEYELVDNDDNTYSAVRPFGVFFSRNGYAKIMATSADEAMKLADEQCKVDDVSWDDDWHPTDAAPAEEEM